MFARFWQTWDPARSDSYEVLHRVMVISHFSHGTREMGHPAW